MAVLVDTNILVYRHDRRDLEKQKAANEILRRGLESGELRIPHQALVEFVSVVTRPSRPYDAHMWACAEANGLEQILSEDFQHGRLYGSVLAVNPFLSKVG